MNKSPEAKPENAGTGAAAFLDAAGEAFEDLTRQLTEAIAAQDHDAREKIVRKLETISERKRAAKKPAKAAPTPATATVQTRGPRSGLVKRTAGFAPSTDKDRWPSAWGEQYRGMPNDLIRNALFNVRQNQPRRKLENAPIATLRNQVVFFTGEELRIRDEDLVMQIFHFARDFKLGEPWQVSGQDFLAGLHRSNGKRGYKELYESLIRLSKGHLTMIKKADGNDDTVVLEAGAILGHLRIEHSKRGGPTLITIMVNPDMRRLWDSMGYTLVNWEQRQKLRSPLSKWLHRFYSSHVSPFPYTLQRIFDLSGSAVESLTKFRQTVRASLRELADMGFLDSWWLDGDDLVHVVRGQRASALLGHDTE